MALSFLGPVLDLIFRTMVNETDSNILVEIDLYHSLHGYLASLK